MGSSTITVTSGVQFVTNLPIGLLSTSALTPNSTDPSAQSFQLRLNQASMVVRLEQLMHAPWGYVPEPNWLIPLPTADLNLTTSVEYKTDLVGFNYACQWQAPNVSRDGFIFSGQTWGLGGAIWTNASSAITNVSLARNGSSILELLPNSRNDTGVSVYAFLGGNSTYAVNSTSPDAVWVDLSGLPSAFSPDGFATYDRENPKVDWVRAPLATLLVCDPRLRFISGSVLLNPTNNLTAPDVTVQSTGGVESPGNINPTAARTLFTVILNQAVGLQYMSSSLANAGQANFNPAAARMFLALPAGTINWDDAGAISPVDVKTINGYVDDFTLSALKVFTSGYRSDTSDEPSDGVDAAVVQAQYTSSRLALATSVQFAILHSVLFVVLAVMLGLLAYLNRTQGRVPFDLVHAKQE
ncbi:hypothetical protein P691DRAFT_702010 [Macrolepiota fuliginosa MF-IS2]|uniref:Transmembrane protein n=1 Tax=Macrolepiota fuliginosa MF-IS2 TaxID=1400762 RepID=A0A9P5XEU8_9AGAR|nr:hypothetical protein P691DRAFT_702010 [Macrolepiota fuliginosa MF-IS2]